jgi:hypothetical protein
LITTSIKVQLGNGNHTMAAILQFQQRSKAEKPEFAPGHSATILMYTGVRFERIDFESLKHQGEHDVDMPAPTRRAN